MGDEFVGVPCMVRDLMHPRERRKMRIYQEAVEWGRKKTALYVV